MIKLKSSAEIEQMKVAGDLVGRTHDMVAEEIRPGMTTLELDSLVERFIRDHSGIPSFKGFRGFPGSACISVNDEVVHGIPGDRVLAEGDIVSVDIGAIVDGWHGDAARTHALGEIPARTQELLDITQAALAAGIDNAQPGNKLGRISAAVQETAEAAGCGVVRQLVGHGIGREMHEEPQVPNFGSPTSGVTLKVGMVLAIEPMINLGTPEVKTLPDGWTIVTADGQPSAHFEHTVAITGSGPVITTLACQVNA